MVYRGALADRLGRAIGAVMRGETWPLVEYGRGSPYRPLPAPDRPERCMYCHDIITPDTWSGDWTHVEGKWYARNTHLRCRRAALHRTR